MEMVVPPQNRKREKMVDPAGDRISELPAKIRLRIISLLTTKDAVKTGALSKRWVDLWTSSPVLRFNQLEFATTASFVNFVDRALALCYGSRNIRRFELRWYHDFDPSTAKIWLNHATSRNVPEIGLTIPLIWGQEAVLPGNLFARPSLERYFLESVAKNTVILGSSSFARLNLTRLRHLQLRNISIPTTFLGELISNAPLLKSLKIKVTGHGVVHTSAPNLRSLTLICDIADNDSRIHISAPRLNYLYCCFSVFVPEIDFGNLMSLAHGRICCCTNQLANGAKLLHIFNGLHNAKILNLQGFAIESLSQVLDLSKHMSLPFCRLKHLELEVLLSEDNIRVVIILLKSFTNVEKLVIHNSKNGEFQSDVNGLEDGWFPPRLDYDCCLSHLEEVCVNGFLGGKDDAGFVNLLLECANTLRNMILRYRKELRNHETWMEISQNMRRIPRKSSTAEVVLSDMS